MIDGIKANVSYLDRNSLIEKLDCNTANHTTGEISTSFYGSYYGLTFKFTATTITLYGSIHKFHSRITTGKNQNYTDFTLIQLIEAFNHLHSELGIDLSLSKIQNLEFGFNIITSQNVSDIINSVIHWKNSQYTKRNKGKFHYLEFKKGERIAKIYDKGKQFGLPNNIARIEFKLLKSRRLPSGLLYLIDLLNVSTWYALFEEFNLLFNCFLFLPPLKTELKKVDNNVYDWSKNPSNWENAAPKTRNRKKGAINNLKNQHDMNQIENEINEKTGYVFPRLINQELGMFSYVDKVGIHTIDKKYCRVTGLNITHQKRQSKYLSESSILSIKKLDKEQYQSLVNKYGSSTKSSTNSLEYYIAHNIRNVIGNQRNKVRDTWKRYNPSLFPISEGKIIEYYGFDPILVSQSLTNLTYKKSSNSLVIQQNKANSPEYKSHTKSILFKCQRTK